MRNIPYKSVHNIGNLKLSAAIVKRKANFSPDQSDFSLIVGGWSWLYLENRASLELCSHEKHKI